MFLKRTHRNGVSANEWRPPQRFKDSTYLRCIAGDALTDGCPQTIGIRTVGSDVGRTSASGASVHLARVDVLTQSGPSLRLSRRQGGIRMDTRKCVEA